MNKILIFTACVMLSSCYQTKTETTEEVIAPTEEVAYASTDQAMEVDKVSMNAAAPAEPAIEQKIIREANLRFQTTDMDETYQQVVAAAKKYKAQIQNDAETKEYNTLTRTLTIRIPNGSFDAFLTDAGKGVTYFDRKEISSQDVTEQYIDTDARLKAKKKLEARYLELLSKANKVSEMLEIEEKLSAVREDIEAKEGQLRYLQNRVAMSTVTLEFYKVTQTQSGVTMSFGARLWNAVTEGFDSISSFFLELIGNWPIILILVGLIFWLRRKFRKRKNQ